MALVSILLMAPARAADWQIYKRVQVRNDDSIILRFDNPDGRGIRIWLVFPRGVAGARSEQPPLYRIDANPVHDLQKQNEVRFQESNHRWLYWYIHRGEKPFSEDLQEFLRGQKVIFQYYLPDGMIKETAFRLQGLQEAIAEIYP